MTKGQPIIDKTSSKYLCSTENASESCTTIVSLPDDIWFLILKGLDAWDICNSRQVSKSWRGMFSRPHYLREVLKRYHCSREVRPVLQNQDRNGDAELIRAITRVGHRYHNLRVGEAREVHRHSLSQERFYREDWYPVGPWDYHESQPAGRLYHKHDAVSFSGLQNRPYLFPATFWSYDDGLVVCTTAPNHGPSSSTTDDKPLAVIDLLTYTTSHIDFDITRKKLRNISFRNRAVVIEWAERAPFHALNASEQVHRHFATCFDVTRLDNGVCEITHRNEWKLHFLGLPFTVQDRFFSIHDGHHYAVYFWQPNRSMYTGDEDMPIESLVVWDISIPSTYYPSFDPSGRDRPPPDERPHPVAVFSFTYLDFLGVRQHSSVSLMNMQIDSETWSLTIQGNVCVAGQGYFDPAERLMCTTAVTFPYRGLGAARRRQWHAELPPYRGHSSMDTEFIEDIEKWFLPVMHVYDDTADVRFSLVETAFTGLSQDNKLMVRLKSQNQWSTLDDELASEITPMGRIAGDERWLVAQNSSDQLVIIKF